ncbi:MAG: glycosyltransferase family 2 protein [Desulfobacteraceae bacterium]|nr:MAG: glycosyltransferase family 2 protein [Desulfobacteraceae bacterium]
MNSVKVTVIIPAYNEAEIIGDLVEKIRALYPEYRIVVINDGSRDNTEEAAVSAGAEVFNHPYNIGNGAAIKSGIRIADGDIFVFMDGDGQHDPEDIEKLVKYIPAFDMVVGARSFQENSSIGRALGNQVYNWLASYVAKFNIQDLTSGFRAVKADVARNFLYMLPNTYSYPTTLTLGILRGGWSVRYESINVKNRQTGKSNINTFKDGVRFFMIITKICTLYSPMRVFLPVSLGMFSIGFFYYIYTFITQTRFTNMSALLFTTSIVIFMMGLVSEQICQMRSERRGSDRIMEDLRKNETTKT